MEGRWFNSIPDDFLFLGIDMEDKMFFGKQLKEVRLKQGFGLRKFADIIGTEPSRYSAIERGYVEPPGSPDDGVWICDVLEHLELEKYDPIMMNLMTSWREPFVMQYMPEVGFSSFVHHTDGTPFSEEELINLHKDFEATREEHNRKADEYNEK